MNNAGYASRHRTQQFPRERLDRQMTRAAVAAMVVIDQLEDILKGVQPGVNHGVLGTHLTVHDQAGLALSNQCIEEFRSVDRRVGHAVEETNIDIPRAKVLFKRIGPT